MLVVSEPVPVRFEAATGILVAEFPVTVSDPEGPGGNIVFVETIALNRSRGNVMARNQRPNASFAYRDVFVPPRGSLTVEAAVGFAPPDAGEEIAMTVRVGLTDGRAVEKTVPATR